MEINAMNVENIFDGMKIPSKPHILETQLPITEAEVENRMRVARELENLGISTSKFDIADEHEDTDVLQAIILINQGKKVPEDLRKRILNKNKENFEEKRNKTIC
ncbi:MAG: hypothetical protein NC231_09390 [Bacillus sp. (in: Bacteria)]|nr:hypothetical protein [Bacillus sp. (in: firmicutes)]MCM1425099.1 hypothetical protein [Eubacterium sp.]